MHIARHVIRKPLLLSAIILLMVLVVVAGAAVSGLIPQAGPEDAHNAGGTKLAAPPQSSPRPSDIEADQQRTARLLSTVNAPGRDLIALTRRLKLGGRGDIPTVVNPTRPDYPVGTRHTFYVADVTSRGYFTITATIRLVTPHAYWYVKDGYRVDMDLLKASAAQFEDHIYPTNRRVFGPEASPGIDNDPRITILIAPTPGVGGYFSSADAYPRIVNPYSNQRDMIYLTSGPTEPSGDPENYFEGTLAHEFQHMIQWNVHRDRQVWLDEGCAEIAMYINGYDVGGVDLAFTASPGTQLNAWAEPTNHETMAHYGAAYLFLRYLMHHYGGETFISTLLRQKGLGEDAIDSALKQVAPDAQSGFDGAFKDWVIANTLNDPALADGRYSYPEGGRITGSRTVRNYPATRSGTVSQYAADYIRISGDLGQARLIFKGDATARVIAADPPNGSHFWYSNRRDTGDATLTREFNLTNVGRATLRFRAWYDIERLFDYAYVEVSTDGGHSWTLLKGKYTTTDNPNGTAFGPGWTGKSGTDPASPPTPASAPARWVEESVDLSTYTGRKVLVRFEYITDEGYNRPGIAIDDISIPEIGYSDNAEADNGWQAEGFVRIGNRMPQKWFVALVERGSPNRVRQMTVDANGNGTLDLSRMGAGSSIREAVLVIAPMAPKTTEPANYTLTFTQR